MNKLLITTAFALFTFSQGMTQNSLQRFLSNLPDTEVKVDSLNEICWSQLNQGNWEEGRLYTTEALQLSNDLDYSLGKAECFMMLGLIAQYYDEDLEKAAVDFSNAFDIRIEEKAYLEAARSCVNLLNLYKQQGKNNRAIKEGTLALKLLEKEKSTDEDFLKTKATLYNSIGDAYYKLSNSKEALKYFEAALEIRTKLKLPKEMMKSYLNLGNLYFDFFKDYKKAEKYYQKGFLIAESEKDIIHEMKFNLLLGNIFYKNQDFEKAIIYYQRLQANDDALKADVLIAAKNLGAIYLEQGNPAKALQIWQKIITDSETILTPSDFAILLSDIGVAYHQLSKNEEALTYLKKGKNIADSLNISSVLIYTIDNLGNFYYRQGNYKEALRLTQLSRNLQDSVTHLAQQAVLYKADLEATRSEQVTLENEKIEIQNTNLILENQSLFLKGMGIITILGLLILLFAFYAYANKKNEEIAWKETDSLLQAQELKLAYARLEGRNEERERVARDLHDGLGGMLATVKLQFAPIERKLEDNQEESRLQFNKAFALLDASCDEVRRISHNLVSSSLKEYGLKYIIEEIAEHIGASKKIEVNVDTFGIDERLDNFLELKIYRIIQELMSNILKHAKAEQIDIQVNRFDNVINLMVEDNGIGFNPAVIKTKKRGIGLENIDKRVKSLDGKWNIDSAVGRGTTVVIDIPVKKNYE